MSWVVAWALSLAAVELPPAPAATLDVVARVEKIDPAERARVAIEIHEFVRKLPGKSVAEDRKAVLDFLSKQPLIKSTSVTSNGLTVVAQFLDGAVIRIHLHRRSRT